MTMQTDQAIKNLIFKLHRSIETRISYSADNAASAVVLFLNIGGIEGPEILACGYEQIGFAKDENDQWKISSYDIEADAKMFEEWQVPW